MGRIGVQHIDKLLAEEANSQKIPCNYGHVGRRKKSLYGVDEAKFQELLVSQRGGCAICWAETKNLVIDHDHQTNQTRGLLCQNCNRLVGVIETGFLQLAINYLKKYGKEI